MSKLLLLRAKVTLGPSHLAALFVSVGLPIFLAIPDDPAHQVRVLLGMLQAFWPMVGAFVFGPLFTKDWESRTQDITAARLPRPLGLFALTLLVGLVVLSLCLALSLVVFSFRVRVPLFDALLAVLPGTFYLAALSILAGTAFRSTGAAILVPISYLLFDVFTGGAHTGPFTLFAGTPAERFLLTASGLVALGWGYFIYQRTPVA